MERRAGDPALLARCEKCVGICLHCLTFCARALDLSNRRPIADRAAYLPGHCVLVQRWLRPPRDAAGECVLLSTFTVPVAIPGVRSALYRALTMHA